MTIFSTDTVMGYILAFLAGQPSFFHSDDSILEHLKSTYGIHMESDDKTFKVIMMRLQLNHKIKARPRRQAGEIVTQYQILRGN